MIFWFQFAAVGQEVFLDGNDGRKVFKLIAIIWQIVKMNLIGVLVYFDLLHFACRVKFKGKFELKIVCSKSFVSV